MTEKAEPKRPKKPIKDTSDNQKKRPSREEEKEYFRKAAESDLLADNLFKNRHALVLG